MLPTEEYLLFFSVLWGMGIDKETPDLYDWVGAGICLVGVAVLYLHHVNNKE